MAIHHEPTPEDHSSINLPPVGREIFSDPSKFNPAFMQEIALKMRVGEDWLNKEIEKIPEEPDQQVKAFSWLMQSDLAAILGAYAPLKFQINKPDLIADSDSLRKNFLQFKFNGTVTTVDGKSWEVTQRWHTRNRPHTIAPVWVVELSQGKTKGVLLQVDDKVRKSLLAVFGPVPFPSDFINEPFPMITASARARLIETPKTLKIEDPDRERHIQRILAATHWPFVPNEDIFRKLSTVFSKTTPLAINNSLPLGQTLGRIAQIKERLEEVKTQRGDVGITLVNALFQIQEQPLHQSIKLVQNEIEAWINSSAPSPSSDFGAAFSRLAPHFHLLALLPADSHCTIAEKLHDSIQSTRTSDNNELFKYVAQSEWNLLKKAITERNRVLNSITLAVCVPPLPIDVASRTESRLQQVPETPVDRAAKPPAFSFEAIVRLPKGKLGCTMTTLAVLAIATPLSLLLYNRETDHLNYNRDNEPLNRDESESQEIVSNAEAKARERAGLLTEYIDSLAEQFPNLVFNRRIRGRDAGNLLSTREGCAKILMRPVGGFSPDVQIEAAELLLSKAELLTTQLDRKQSTVEFRISGLELNKSMTYPTHLEISASLAGKDPVNTSFDFSGNAHPISGVVGRIPLEMNSTLNLNITTDIKVIKSSDYNSDGEGGKKGTTNVPIDLKPAVDKLETQIRDSSLQGKLVAPQPQKIGDIHEKVPWHEHHPTAYLVGEWYLNSVPVEIYSPLDQVLIEPTSTKR